MGMNQSDIESVAFAEADRLRWRYWLVPALVAVDMLMVWLTVQGSSAAYHALAYGHFGDLRLTSELSAFLAIIFLFTNVLQGRYRVANYLTPQGQIADAFKVWSIALIAFLAFAFMAKVIDNYSRAVVLISYLAGIPVIALARRKLAQSVANASRAGRIAIERVLIVGRENDVLGFVSRHRPWNVGFVIVDAAFLDIPDTDHPDEASAALQLRLEDAKARVRRLRPDSVFIAAPWSEKALIERCAEAFMSVPAAIHLAPEEIMDRFRQPRISRIGGLSSLQLTRAALSPVEVMVKRVFDIVVSGTALILLAPVLALIAVALRLEGRGPVFFTQRRYGFNQNMFRIFKFRTMTTAEDGAEVRQAQRNDPRVTRVGRFLRRYNLDELPQLLNVLSGDMSLVGPRPHALVHDDEFEEKIALYARRHNVKPGITGWAQVNGLRGPTETDDKMRRRVDHDLWYIDNWSLGLDVLIVLRTLFSASAYRNAF
jgi:Undecaprenyl-phosphate glucose phosphotransferase